MAYSASQLVSMGYPGYAGWGDAEANADFNATGGAGKKPSTPSVGNNTTSIDPNAFAAKSDQALSDMFNKDTTDVNQLTSDFQSALPSITDYVNQKYNVPQLATEASNLGARIQNLQGNGNNNASGYANADQVDKAINTNYLPAFNAATTNAQTAEGLASTEAQRLILPYTTKADLLNQRIASEMTGFTSTQKNELDALLGNLNAGVTLTKEQMDTANQLAIAEGNWQNALNQISANQKYFTLTPGSSLFNTSTNSTVGSGGNGVNVTNTGGGSSNFSGGSSVNYSDTDYQNWLKSQVSGTSTSSSGSSLGSLFTGSAPITSDPYGFNNTGLSFTGGLGLGS